MDRFKAVKIAYDYCSGDAYKLVGKLEQLGFAVIATNSPPRMGDASAAVRRAIDAHSPLPNFFTQQIIDWLDANHGRMPRKQVYNALAYLVRIGELRHVARGSYACNGNIQPDHPGGRA